MKREMEGTKIVDTCLPRSQLGEEIDASNVLSGAVRVTRSGKTRRHLSVLSSSLESRESAEKNIQIVQNFLERGGHSTAQMERAGVAQSWVQNEHE